MLETGRDRFYFKSNPQAVIDELEQFAEEHDGQPEEGFKTLTIYSFRPDISGSPKFATIAVRIRPEPATGTQGNVTLRWRDEPDGPYQSIVQDFIERLEEKFEDGIG